MDHVTSHDRCRSHTECRRKMEPYIFFFGVVFLVLVAITAVLVEGSKDIGPQSAQGWSQAGSH